MTREAGGDIRLSQAEMKLIAKEAAKEALSEHAANCPMARDFGTMYVDFYGVPGKKDESPGVMGDVQDLKHSRKTMIWGLRAVWTVLASTPVLGWVLSHFWTAAK